MPSETVIYEKKGHIAFVTLNRPQKLNAINEVMDAELQRVWQDFNDDGDLWVAVLTGSGRAFCAGADVIADFVADETKPPALVHFTPDGEAKVFQGPKRCGCWKPVILAVNGLCIGGGLYFVGDSDIVICSDDAWFGDAHTALGQVLSWEALGILGKLPLDTIMRMALLSSAEKLSARRAYELGLVGEVLPREELLPRATELAETMCRNAPLALQGTVRAIRQELRQLLRPAYSQGMQIIMGNWPNEDTKEGPRAFAQKRAPQWKAR